MEVGRLNNAAAPQRVGLAPPPWRGSCRALAELHLAYDDDPRRSSAVPEWKASTGSSHGGPARWRGLRLPPRIPTRLHDSLWSDAVLVDFPDGVPTIVPAEHDPVRVVETFAVTWRRLGPERPGGRPGERHRRRVPVRAAD